MTDLRLIATLLFVCNFVSLKTDTSKLCDLKTILPHLIINCNLTSGLNEQNNVENICFTFAIFFYYKIFPSVRTVFIRHVFEISAFLKLNNITFLEIFRI